MVCITQKTDALRKMLDEDGTPYYLCNCTSGHDLKLFFAIRHVVKTFRPDVIHLHDIRLFGALYLRYFTKIPRVCSIHLPSNPNPRFSRRLLNWAVQPCYWLPVSKNNWDRFSTYHPGVKGEVFFNPIRIEKGEKVTDCRIDGLSDCRGGRGQAVNQSIVQSVNFIVGMVGRNAVVKDWPAFHRVEEIVKFKAQSLKLKVEFLNAGEKEVCNGREAIGKMDLFVMTSKSEELPTTVLECFALGTPICGFLPVGGTKDILEFSTGPLREVFIVERNCEKLADIVMDLLTHPEKRKALVEDGRQILEGHFDAEKNCRGRLMEIYRERVAEVGK